MPGDAFIAVPDVLGTLPAAAERLLASLPDPGSRFDGFDLSRVAWVRPFGAIILLHACVHAARRLGVRVRLVGLRQSVHAYLQRIDFFEHGDGLVYTRDRLDPASTLSRSSTSCNLLACTPIRSGLDIYGVVDRARHILDYLQGHRRRDIGHVVSLLSEPCSNIVDHSQSTGIVTIQKYERGIYTDVEVAIGDMGLGIRRTLSAVRGAIASTTPGFIRHALDGASSRSSDAIGQGLGSIETIATTSGGSLYIRSDDGGILARGGSRDPHARLATFPGTHMSITFRSAR